MFAWCLADVLRTFYYRKGDINAVQTTYAGDVNTASPIVAPSDDDVRASTSIRHIKTPPNL